MNTRFLFLSFFLTMFTTSHLYSQANHWIFGIEAGINYSNSTEETAPLDKNKFILYRVGVEVNYLLTPNIFFQSGVIYSAKGIGSKGEGKIGKMNINGKIDLNQQVLQLPLYLGYTINLRNNKLNFIIGPYVAYGIGGKTNANGLINGNPFNKKVDTFGDGDILKKFDFVLGLGAGYEIKHWYVKANYELGLLDIGHSNIMGGKLSYKNRIASLSLGYHFSL